MYLGGSSRTIAIKQFFEARQTPLSCPKHAARLHIEIAASQIAGKDSVSDSDLAKRANVASTLTSAHPPQITQELSARPSGPTRSPSRQCLIESAISMQRTACSRRPRTQPTGLAGALGYPFCPGMLVNRVTEPRAVRVPHHLRLRASSRCACPHTPSPNPIRPARMLSGAVMRCRAPPARPGPQRGRPAPPHCQRVLYPARRARPSGRPAPAIRTRRGRADAMGASTRARTSAAGRPPAAGWAITGP